LLKARLLLDPKTQVKLSKLLRAVLKHVPSSIGLTLSRDE
jgi:RNA:NAD 2'-phosphotransferase (TPT1/KptA family)